MSHMKLNFGYGDLLLNIPANLEILVGGALLQTPQWGHDMLILLIENLQQCYIHSLHETNMSKNPEHLLKDL